MGLKYAKNALAAGARRPDPAVGAHDAPPDPLIGWEGDTPPNPYFFGAFGASILAPSALSFCGPNVKFWLRPCTTKQHFIRMSKICHQSWIANTGHPTS